MILNCVIIDDEPLAADLLASYAEKIPFLNLIGTFNSAVEGIRVIKEKNVDLLFLDIQMPELSGLEFASIVGNNTKIIFTTAFSQYAIEGYKVNALDYLLKPISYEEFLRASNMALEYFSAARKAEISSRDRFIFIKKDYKLVRVDLDDILYFMGEKDYVRVCLVNGEVISSLMNIKKLETYLPRPEFMRIHRSYIVHMNKVSMVERSNLVLGDTVIPISGSYKDEVQAFLDEHSL